MRMKTLWLYLKLLYSKHQQSLLLLVISSLVDVIYNLAILYLPSCIILTLTSQSTIVSIIVSICIITFAYFSDNI